MLTPVLAVPPTVKVVVVVRVGMYVLLVAIAVSSALAWSYVVSPWRV
jgi:hypothetical protein